MRVLFKHCVSGFLFPEGRLAKRSIFIVCCGLLLLAAPRTQAQNSIHVVGHIMSDSGQVVGQATITVKGSKTGVSSDDNGNFDIQVPADATLTISSIGYAPATIKVAGRHSLQIVLTHASNALDQVIVVGYGSQKASDVTGSVARVSAATLAEVPSPNFINELQGRTAGVDIVNNSATPGGGGQIRIRGSRSMATSTSVNANGVGNAILSVITWTSRWSCWTVSLSAAA